jgi:hypothetical protein
MKTRDELDRLSSIILDSAITVHKEMGPGLLEIGLSTLPYH